MGRMVDVKYTRDEFALGLTNKDFVIDKSGVKTIEIIGTSFIAHEDHIFGETNPDYIARELEWYKSQSLFVKDIPGKVPAIWEAVADKDGKINSNYGYLIWSYQNWNQYGEVILQLKANPDSRRAIMIYTRPSIHLDYNRNGMSDFICTNTVQYFIRDGVLTAVVNMRSNDAVFGYRNDLAWQEHVLAMLAKDLGVLPGYVIWQTGSLHIYERHFYLVHHYAQTGETHISLTDFKERYGDITF